MIHLCYLAAGSGRRFGSNKLLADVGGAPLWRHGYRVLCRVRDTLGARLHVVSRYADILDAVGEEGVYAPDSERGKSYSVKAACTAAEPLAAGDVLLFLTADQPGITAETVLRLARTALSPAPEQNGPLMACVFDGEHDGNPVVFSACLAPELMSLEGDAGGKSLFARYPDRLARVPASPGELRDVDTVRDLPGGSA